MTPSRYLRHARDARHSQSLRTRARRRLAASLRSPLASGLAAGVAGLALGAAAGPAQAQSSVTLYGTIDTAIVYANNAGGKRQFEMNSSNVLGNRWGLRGSEDLGNGLRAVFDLENGYSSTTGGFQQGGDLFGRQAWVGLASQRAGTLTAGRQYDAVVDFIGPFIAGTQWATYLGGHPGDLDNTNNDYRSNNSVKYTTPTYRGLRASGLYSFGGTPGQFGRNSIWSLGVGYTGGPDRARRAPTCTSRTRTSPTSATTRARAPPAATWAASRVYSGYASAGDEQIVAVGGTYTAGPAIIGAVYTNTRFGELGAHASLDPLGYRGSASFHNAELNLRYYLTPVWLLGAAYDYTRGYGVNHVTYQQGDLGITYILSKRTQLYLVGLYQHASGTDSSGQAAVGQHQRSERLVDAEPGFGAGRHHASVLIKLSSCKKAIARIRDGLLFRLDSASLPRDAHSPPCLNLSATTAAIASATASRVRPFFASPVACSIAPTTVGPTKPPSRPQVLTSPSPPASALPDSREGREGEDDGLHHEEHRGGHAHAEEGQPPARHGRR